jgi:uncharacterized protein involved in response to NO
MMHGPSPLFAKGFRPFFLGAVLFAMIGMGQWMAAYLYQWPVPLDGISVYQWHGHEMIFGYSMAVIAGFLLTAAQNWTGEKTAHGFMLAILILLWAAARVLMIFGTRFLLPAMLSDMLFMLGLAVAVARPVIQVRQTRQAPVLLIVAALAAANLAFYLGAAGLLAGGAWLGLYSGLYLVLGLVLFMGRRVIPFFTERGLEPPVKIKNARWNDIATYTLYPLFVISEMAAPLAWTGAVLAGLLFILNSFRVSGWHTLAIWQKPLLWGLFAAFLMINLGFLLRGLMPVTAVPPYLHIHAFTLGGIGIVTISMMARVTIGHTGRNVHAAPPIMTLLLVGMALSTLFRLFFPLLDPAHYTWWIAAAGALWMVSFGLFAFTFFPMLVAPRIDGKPG